MSDLSDYERLVGLIERELVFAAAGRVEDVACAQRDKQELIAGLPDRPPAEALPLLDRAATVQAHVSAVLERCSEETLRVLGDLQVAHRTANGYAASARADARDGAGLDHSA